MLFFCSGLSRKMIRTLWVHFASQWEAQLRNTWKICSTPRAKGSAPTYIKPSSVIHLFIFCVRVCVRVCVCAQRNGPRLAAASLWLFSRRLHLCAQACGHLRKAGLPRPFSACGRRRGKGECHGCPARADENYRWQPLRAFLGSFLPRNLGS